MSTKVLSRPGPIVPPPALPAEQEQTVGRSECFTASAELGEQLRQLQKTQVEIDLRKMEDSTPSTTLSPR